MDDVRAILLDEGRGGWWFLQGGLVAHLASDVLPLDGFAVTRVLFRCGLRTPLTRIRRAWVEGRDIRRDKCRGCTMRLEPTTGGEG